MLQSRRRLGGREWIFETDGEQWNRTFQEEASWIGSGAWNLERWGWTFWSKDWALDLAPVPQVGLWAISKDSLGRELEKEMNGGGCQNKEGVSPTNRVLRGNV